jgi:hypothetical protein
MSRSGSSVVVDILRRFPVQNPLNRLLYSRKFWLAVVACAQTILFQFVPSFPREVWQSIDALIVVVIATIAVEDAAAKANLR